LKQISECYQSLLLSINPLKSRYIIFSLASRPTELENQPKIATTNIQRVKQLKYLGVLLDERLSFAAHTARSCSNAKRAIGTLHRSIGKFVGPDLFAHYYSAKILPALTYALPVSAPTTTGGWTQIERIQKFAARMISNDYQSAYSDLLKQRKWKSMQQLCFEQRSRFMHKFVQGTAYLPPNAVIEQQQNRQLRNRYQNQPIFTVPNLAPRTTTDLPFYDMILTWNFLPANFADVSFATLRTSVARTETFNRTLSSLNRRLTVRKIYPTVIM